MRLKLVLAALLLMAQMGGGVVVAPSASAAGTDDAAAAVGAATAGGYRSAIGVMDTTNGQYWGAGDFDAQYASESVMKVFIAANLLKTGQMSGWNETTAYKMITQSDDASANALYGRTGGDNVVMWAAQTYNIPFLGAPPPLPGWWGGTRITAHGMAAFYNAVTQDPAVGPWLINAMRNATPNGSDGTYQYFGIPSAATTWAVKQGWGADSPDGQPVFNSTGMVGPGDRFAVAILTQGPGYGAPIANMVTDEAQILLPGGTVSPPVGGNPWAEFWQWAWDYLVNLARTNHWFGL
ncbi:MAG: serine hydrolase [Mycobacteriaceae bacterium]